MTALSRPKLLVAKATVIGRASGNSLQAAIFTRPGTGCIETAMLFPPVFDDDLLVAVNAYYGSDMSRRYRHGIHISGEPHHLFVHAYWSAASVWADQKLQAHELLPKEVLKIDPLPRNEIWGFLMPFCHGFGEYFIFEDGRCEFYAPLGKERAAFDGYAEMICKHDRD